jgi:hypothetical protein
MLTPSKYDCIAILSAAERVSSTDEVVRLSYQKLGLSLNSLDAAAAFLMERGCFVRCSGGHGDYEIGRLSQQGKWRLEQLVHG